jgi:hypothetical protein
MNLCGCDITLLLPRSLYAGQACTHSFSLVGVDPETMYLCLIFKRMLQKSSQKYNYNIRLFTTAVYTHININCLFHDLLILNYKV